jgi:hypothetical protein
VLLLPQAYTAPVSGDVWAGIGLAP